MGNNERSLAIDAGNTRVKVGLFHGKTLEEMHFFGEGELEQLKQFLAGHQHLPAIIGSVKSDKDTKWLRNLLSGAIVFTTSLKLPLKIAYETPETLGVDRLCNAIAAWDKTQKAALVIDMGTCIKYDFVSADATYEGGAISPGIAMRYKAMHTFTGKLPLIDDMEPAPATGKNTFDAMRSGVMNAVRFELEGFIAEYRKMVPELTIFLTGGDAEYFANGLKNDIFADENLTLKGLQLTLAQL